jgi:hypothetical protein
MNDRYGYLKHYIPGGNNVDDNWFCPVSEQDIKAGEKKMGQMFPTELRNFYQEIGYGMLRSPANPPVDYEFYGNNEILHPDVSASFYQGVLEHQLQPKEEAICCCENWLALPVLENLQPGDLPFFEIGDSSSFMIMKTQSDNPNAVWSDCGVKIEDSFERFIWRLYYEDPSYYGKIICKHYGISEE